MTLRVLDAGLDVFEVGNSDETRSNANSTIPRSDIELATITSRIQSSRDRARFAIDNDGAVYNSDVTIGDRVQFYTQLEGESSLSKRWTGMVVDRQFNIGAGDTNTLTLVLEDFVFAVLSRRFITNVYADGVQLAGTSSSVVNDMVATEASELKTAGVDSIPDKVELEYQRTNLLDALGELAKRYDAVLTSAGVDVVFKKRGSLPTEFQLRTIDRMGGFRSGETNRDMVNDVVVDGARETALDIEQTQQDSFETVTDSNRRTEQLDVRKAQIASVELYVKKGPDDQDLLVRVQSDDGNGNPVDASNEKSDVTQAKVPGFDLPTEDWFKVELPDHKLQDPNPHVLVEATGSTGHEVGYDSGTDDLTYRVNYYYSVTPNARDPNSVINNRRHEGRYRRETIRGDAEGDDIAKGIINRRSKPQRTLRFGADSVRAHNLDAGEVVYVDEGKASVDEDMVVFSKRERYDGLDLGTAVELRSKRSI